MDWADSVSVVNCVRTSGSIWNMGPRKYHTSTVTINQSSRSPDFTWRTFHVLINVGRLIEHTSRFYQLRHAIVTPLILMFCQHSSCSSMYERTGSSGRAVKAGSRIQYLSYTLRRGGNARSPGSEIVWIYANNGKFGE